MKSENRLSANYHEGNTDEKQYFQHLLDLANEYSLIQIVDKPTRETSILDLTCADNPTIFQPYNTTPLRPMSDHNLMMTLINRVSNGQTQTKNKRADGKLDIKVAV